MRGARHGCMGILLLLLAALSAVWAVRTIAPARARQAQAVAASAAITRADQHFYRDKTRKTPLYSYEYEFSVDGHVYRGVWNASQDSSHRVGEIIPIYYLRSNPADNNYGGTLNDAPWQSPSLELAMAVILAVVGLGLLRRRGL